MEENYEIKNEKIKAHLQLVARQLKSETPKGWGFTILMFDLDTTKGSMFYLSSAERASMIAAMEEFITKQKNYA